MQIKRVGFCKITKDDIPDLHAIRMAVKENVLSDPNKITAVDYAQILEQGKGWLCRINRKVAGFAIG